MRQILLSIILTYFTSVLMADCSPSAMWAYPSSKKISTNSLIILEGYGTDQKIINSLNVGYPIFITTYNHTVKLNVIEVCKGMYHVTQAILKPAEKLKPNKTYKIQIFDLNGNLLDKLNYYNSKSGKTEPRTWLVKNNIDNTKPTWKNKPEFLSQNVHYYGCGPSVHAIFSTKVKDKSQTFVKAELTDLKTNKTNSYYLLCGEDNKVEVGHNMCSGAFTFSGLGKYKIRFRLMDISGNTDTECTDWIKFDSPMKERNSKIK